MTKTQDIPRAQIVPSSTKLIKRSKIVKLIQKNYAQITTSSPAQEIIEKT